MSRKKIEKDLARQRIKILLSMAMKKYEEDKAFAKNCVRIAMRIKMKYNLKFPEWFRNLYCKRCYNLLLPSISARVRIEGKGKNIKVITTCLECGRKIRKEFAKFKLEQIDRFSSDLA